MILANEGTCPSCERAVLWVEDAGLFQTARPFDLEPEPRYLLSQAGIHLVDTYTSHLDTCPTVQAKRQAAEVRNLAAPR